MSWPRLVAALTLAALLVLAALGFLDGLYGSRPDRDSRCPYEQAVLWPARLREVSGE